MRILVDEIHGWSPKYLTPALEQEIRNRLKDRVMFGGDSGAAARARRARLDREEGYDDALLETIFDRNAEAYFGARR